MNLADAVAQVAASPHMYRFSPDALKLVVEAAQRVVEGERVWKCHSWGEFTQEVHPRCNERDLGSHDACGWVRVVAE